MSAHLMVALTTQTHSYVLCQSASFYSAGYACVEVMLLFIDNGSKRKCTEHVVLSTLTKDDQQDGKSTTKGPTI